MLKKVPEKCPGTCEGCFYDKGGHTCQHPKFCTGELIGCGAGEYIFTGEGTGRKKFRHLLRRGGSVI